MSILKCCASFEITMDFLLSSCESLNSIIFLVSSFSLIAYSFSSISSTLLSIYTDLIDWKKTLTSNIGSLDMPFTYVEMSTTSSVHSFGSNILNKPKAIL
jgi:hypothetical protein